MTDTLFWIYYLLFLNIFRISGEQKWIKELNPWMKAWPFMSHRTDMHVKKYILLLIIKSRTSCGCIVASETALIEMSELNNGKTWFLQASSLRKRNKGLSLFYSFSRLGVSLLPFSLLFPLAQKEGWLYGAEENSHRAKNTEKGGKKERWDLFFNHSWKQEETDCLRRDAKRKENLLDDGWWKLPRAPQHTQHDIR